MMVANSPHKTWDATCVEYREPSSGFKRWLYKLLQLSKCQVCQRPGTTYDHPDPPAPWW